LALAYSYAERHGGDPAPITKLSEVFFDYDRDDFYLSSVKRSQPFQTRRLIQALIRRGLIEEAGTAISQTGGTQFSSGLYYPKGWRWLASCGGQGGNGAKFPGFGSLPRTRRATARLVLPIAPRSAPGAPRPLASEPHGHSPTAGRPDGANGLN
jgi:hypothetical protein